VVRITGNFQQEIVLHPAASALLTELFDKGWHDPAKINQQSRQTAILLQQAKESFAKQLQVDSNEIEFIGEVDLGFQLGIQGLLTENSKLIHSTIDRQKVFAVAKYVENLGRNIEVLPVNTEGVIEQATVDPQDVLVWQIANGETGNRSGVPLAKCQIFADCTSSGVDLLANFDYQTALFDSTSWAGPAGLGILIIKSTANWRNPLPHNDLVRVPNTFSVALALASAVALENYVKDEDIRSKLKGEIIKTISAQINDVDIASASNGISKYLSISIKYIEADRLLLDLEDKGFSVDSGSACKSADMQPSHVLSAMGKPISGNIRLTLHKDITESEVKNFCSALKSSVEKLRAN
jgi:cysteine desulfurase